ncbi:unnamed protein product [Urochloa humidicola]
MEEEETRLRFALTVRVGNASREFSVEDVAAAVSAATGLRVESFSVVPTFQESFLIICASQMARDQVLGASPIPMATTSLPVLPWT